MSVLCAPPQGQLDLRGLPSSAEEKQKYQELALLPTGSSLPSAPPNMHTGVKSTKACISVLQLTNSWMGLNQLSLAWLLLLPPFPSSFRHRNKMTGTSNLGSG